MKVPPYLRNSGQESEENYNEELNQNLHDVLGTDGWIPPALTNANLTSDVYIDPEGNQTTIAAFYPDGSLWFVTDASPPCYVGKIAGSLVKFTTTAYP
jgi:streptogramin lyase